MVTLQELIVFLEAADSGSFSKAGLHLHLSQPAVSQNIHSLEKHFGKDLFTRHGRYMRLTEAGQMLVPMARELLVYARRLEETMIAPEGEIVGEVNLGCSTTAGKYLLPGIIARFRKSFPQVRVNMLVGDRQEVSHWLQEGRLQMGICSRPIQQHDFEYQPFFADLIDLIVPSGHPWAQRTHIQTEELLDAPLILREEGAASREALLEILSEQGITLDMLNAVMILGDAQAIEMAVGEGIGVSFISRLAAEQGIKQGRFARVDVQGVALEHIICAVRKSSMPDTRAASEFWEFLCGQRWAASNNLELLGDVGHCMSQAANTVARPLPKR